MRNANVKVTVLAALLLSLAACGGHSEAPGPQVAAIPGATVSSGAGPAGADSGADRQLPFGATKEIDPQLLVDAGVHQLDYLAGRRVRS